MKEKLNQSMLDHLVETVIKKKHIYGAVFYVSSEDNEIDLISAAGNIQEDSPYYIASINKFFISSVILRLYTQNKLDLHDRIAKHLSEDIIRGFKYTPIKELGDVAKEIKYHQEQYDGGGYPEGLKGSEIPLIARIIAVCDAFDAIVTDRPYRRRKTPEEAIQIIQKQSGTQFDPVIVSAFLLAYEKGKILNNRKA